MSWKRCRDAATGLVLILILTGCRADQSAPAGAPPVPRVTVASPLVLPVVEWDEYTGRLDAIDFVEIRARISGYLESYHFGEGQVVRAGDLLFVVDPRPFQAELNSARARVVEAEAKLAESEALLRQSEANQNDAVAQLDLRKRQYQRLATLRQSNATSQDELDVAESERIQAAANLESARSLIESARAGIATSLAAIETARSNVATAELNLSYTRIIAPISGRISRRLVSEGNLINGGTAGSTLLTTIVSLSPIHCYFDANEQEFLKYARLSREGKRGSSRDVKNPVYMRLVDEKGFPHTGHMDFVDNRIDPNTGTMRGRAIFPNEDNTLTPGLFAQVRLPGSGRYDAILIPDSAIGSDQSEKFVYVIGADSQIERRNVEPGPLAKGLRIVRSGLDGSEQVVTRGLQKIFPGIAVEASVETIEATDGNGLPDDYRPVPREEWLSENTQSYDSGAAAEPTEPQPSTPQEAGRDQ